MTRVFARCELATVLADARAQAERSLYSRGNLIIVRLECCRGRRVSEIGLLRLDDVNVDCARPHIRARWRTTKGQKARCVTLRWDVGMLTDLAEWQAERMRHGARGCDPFVCRVLSHRRGRPIQWAAIRSRFLSVGKVFGLDTTRQRFLALQVPFPRINSHPYNCQHPPGSSPSRSEHWLLPRLHC